MLYFPHKLQFSTSSICSLTRVLVDALPSVTAEPMRGCRPWRAAEQGRAPRQRGGAQQKLLSPTGPHSSPQQPARPDAGYPCHILPAAGNERTPTPANKPRRLTRSQGFSQKPLRAPEERRGKVQQQQGNGVELLPVLQAATGPRAPTLTLRARNRHLPEGSRVRNRVPEPI